MSVKKKLFFSGIAGTGMGSVAGLFQALGFPVSGSDNAVYPPMSLMLEKLGIKVYTPYSENNISEVEPDLVIIGNALSRGNPEVEFILREGIPYTSFPALLGEEILDKNDAIVVTGTHGKTTTTSLISHLLSGLGLDPSYLIGGVPVGKEHSFHVGSDPFFIIEGDEYDTAFFDKGPKFLHYRPKYLIVNNIEFDHADIYKNIEEIYVQFMKLIQLVADTKNVIVNIDDAGVREVLTRLNCISEVTSVATRGLAPDADYVFIRDLKGLSASSTNPWYGSIRHGDGSVHSLSLSVPGEHNLANAAMAYALIQRLAYVRGRDFGKLGQDTEIHFKTFRGVKRRIELIAEKAGTYIYEDFAHHPTAIAEGIKSLRLNHPGRRLLVAFEPKNATSRRNIFTDDLAISLSLADAVYIGACPVDMRIPPEQRMDTGVLGKKVGKKAKTFATNELLWNSLKNEIAREDIVIFMSSSSFDGLQKRAAEFVGQF